MIPNRPAVAIVVPCYNEAEVLPETAKRIERVLDRLVADARVSAASHVMFIDDGSVDQTWPIIVELCAANGRFGAIRLSRNRGHQNALMAGLLRADGDIIISIDADLQDDVGAITDMLQAAAAGSDIVYGVRSARTSDTAIKRNSAQLYYRLLRMLNVEVVFDHADYRLMTRRAVEALREYRETNLFLRALIPQLGFKTSVVTYHRAERFAGVSKYPVRKMLALAIEGVTSFSTRPLRWVTFLGAVTSVFALVLTLWALCTALLFNAAVPGWASTVVPIYLICGVQLLSLGIIGEYVGKIYMETKRRPLFHVAEVLPPSTAVAARIVTPLTRENDRRVAAS